jgi:hypothetical protein
MKYPFLIFIFLCLLGISVNAQPHQGPVQIINSTDCEIMWNVVAVCPEPCTQYSTETANFLPPGGYISYWPSDYPWYSTPPPCDGEWTWSFAEVWLVADEGEYCATPLRVSLYGVPNCTDEIYPQVDRFECTCNGKPVTISFSIVNPGGIATVNVTQ